MEAPRRGLGPFSGTQLTVIVVALIASLMVPAGAIAAKAASTAITSPNGRQVARVAGGRLAVQTQPLGTITTQPAAPSQLFVTPSTFVGEDVCVPVISAPSSRSMVITAVRLNVVTVANPGNNSFFGLYANPSCTGSYLLDTNPPTVGLVNFDLGSGLPLKAGHSLYAKTPKIQSEVGGSGYYVPAAAVPLKPDAGSQRQGNQH